MTQSVLGLVFSVCDAAAQSPTPTCWSPSVTATPADGSPELQVCGQRSKQLTLSLHTSVSHFSRLVIKDGLCQIVISELICVFSPAEGGMRQLFVVVCHVWVSEPEPEQTEWAGCPQTAPREEEG